MNIHGYPKIYRKDHRLASGAFMPGTFVVVQEKVDGSQFSFGVIDGKLAMRSKRVELIDGNIPKGFRKAVETVKNLYAEGLLTEGWVYRGEVLDNPKHNTLKYARVPEGNIILFDIELSHDEFAKYEVVRDTASVLGISVVPLYFCGIVNILTQEMLDEFLTRESVLGGTTVEGVVIKAYGRFDANGNVLMVKYVRPDFQEMNSKWKQKRPRQSASVSEIGRSFATEARWNKAIQRLRDAGELANSPRDIGRLIAEVENDIEKEEVDAIKELLWQRFRHDILRAATGGLPEWYKDKLGDK